MSEVIKPDLTKEAIAESEMPSEHQQLLRKAKKLNIAVKGNASVETLRALIEQANPAPAEEPKVSDENMTKNQRYRKIRMEATKKIRVRVNCLNPHKKGWKGEIIKVGNKAIGTIAEFVPYIASDQPDGHHLSQVIVDAIEARHFNEIIKFKTESGEPAQRFSKSKEFFVEFLPALTEEDLAQLAKMQAAKGGVNPESEQQA